MRYLSLLGGLTFALGVSSACSLVHDLSADQCELDTDCEALGGEFRGRQCLAGVCVARPGSGTGGSGGSGGMDQGECSKTRDCTENPEKFGPHVCLDRECVPLTNTACPVLYPSDQASQQNLLRKDSEPIILGGFIPLTVTLETRYSINYDLAFSEFNEETQGVVGADGRRRAILQVVCDDPVGDQAKIEASLDHLVDTLKVPGIVAAMSIDDLAYAFEYKRQVEHPPFYMSSLEGDPLLTTIQDGGLMWHVLPTGEQLSVPYKPLLTRVLDALELEEPARVALITDPDIPVLTQMTATILDETDGKGIEFNGKTALTNGEETFRSFAIRNSVPATAVADVVAELHEFKPHVIISNTTTAFFTQIYEPLEKDWLAKTDNMSRPFYFMSPYHYNTPQLQSKISSIRARFAGANATVGDPRLVRAYFGRLDAAYGNLAEPGFENFYDAPYYTMYAVAKAARDRDNFYGEHLADAMSDLIERGAREWNVGPGNIGKTLQDLASGPIRLNGLLGPPDWDPSTGARTTPGSIWCGNTSSEQIPDAFVYDFESEDLELGVDAAGAPYEESPCAAKF